jgi:hypothetical protein
LKPEIINRQLKLDGKRQACGHSLHSLKKESMNKDRKQQKTKNKIK